VWRALEFTKPAMNMALPALRDESGNTATSIDEKRQMMMDHAFPLPPSDLCDDYIFKPASHFNKSISREMIAASIWGQASKKSPGPDGISAQLEANGGLHWGQFGGRKKRSAVDAVAYVMNPMHIAWYNGHIAGLLLMDVKGAFDHVNHRRLLTTMVAKKLDGDLIEWTEDFLTNRTVQITVDGFDGEVSQINTGISQGSPVSPI
jgi:hypothetical protein